MLWENFRKSRHTWKLLDRIILPQELIEVGMQVHERAIKEYRK